MHLFCIQMVCQPSVTHTQAMRKGNGHFTVQVSKQKVWVIIELLTAGHHVPSHLLQYRLQQVFPQSPVVLNAHLLTNKGLKAKSRGFMCTIKSMNISHATLQELKHDIHYLTLPPISMRVKSSIGTISDDNECTVQPPSAHGEHALQKSHCQS